MNRDSIGRYLPLSPARRIVSDMLYFAKKIPTVPVQRLMHLAPLREARAASARKISWTVLFTKAFALLARDTPVFRQSHVSFPWPQIYEHPYSNPSIPGEFDYKGERIIFGLTVRAPEQVSLDRLQEILDRFRAQPIEKYGNFRKGLAVAKMPRFLRRLINWYFYEVSGPQRAKYLGTFGVSVYSGLGAESLHPIAPWTATLNYGVIAPDGSVTVRVVYDHRLMDGATVARALNQLETILNGPIAQELAALAPEARTQAAA